MKQTLAMIVMLIIAILLGMVDWKLDYGGKVDDRIEQLENRVEALEKQISSTDGSEGCGNEG